MRLAGAAIGVCLAAVPAAAPPAPLAPPGAESVQIDLAYAGDDSKQTLDLYLPANRPFATVVWTYGGGWHAGSGKSSAPIARLLQRHGYGVALVTHRLGPEHRFPAQAQDLASAFAWVATHIAERGGDPARLVLAGHSSGAHLALLLACDPRYLAVHHLAPADVRAVIGISTPVDLEPRADGEGFGDALLGGHGADTFNRDTTLMRDASPVNHVHAGLPPVLLLVGEQDFPMLPGDAQQFADKAAQAGGHVDVQVVAGRTHMSIVGKMLEDDDVVQRRVLEFLEQGAAATPASPGSGRTP